MTDRVVEILKAEYLISPIHYAYITGKRLQQAAHPKR
jgi:hypothetical protein